MSKVQHLNPDGLIKSPAFTQAILVPANARTLYIGGQNAVDGEGQLVGGDDVGAQTAQALKNLRACLQAAGGDFEHLVKCTIHLVAGQSLQAGFAAWQKAAGTMSAPPTVTMAFVSGLGQPQWLVEIEGIAVLP